MDITQHLHQSSSTSPNLNTTRPRNGGNEMNTTNGNQYEPMNQNDLEEETRELQELLSYVFLVEKKI